LHGVLRILAAGAVVVGVSTPIVRRRLGLAKPVASALAWQAPVALALAVPRTRARDAGIYFLQMWAYVAHYEMPNDDPDRLRARLRVMYPVKADRLIGLGETPTIRLQRALGRPGQVRPHDVALSWVHWVWYFVPHGSLLFVLVRHPERFPRSATSVAAVFDLGLVGYWAVPTAPPWYAGQTGAMPPVRRIMSETGERFWGRAWRPLYDALSGNPFAAMPSLHFATSVMAAHVLSDVGRLPGALGWAYAGTLGFGLVYLGEHYVLDLAAGLALAEAVRRLGPVAAPVLRRVAERIQQLEPRAA